MKKTTKLISILLVMAMLLSMAPMTVLAAENLTDTTTSVTLKDSNGNGLYEIGTAAELYAFANLVNAGNTSVNVELTADITLNENVLKEDGTLNGDGTNFTPWVPIGGEENKFAGVFDGKKHTISGLYYNGTDTYVGLFGGVDGKYQSDTIGVIKNIAIVDSYLKTTVSGNNVWVRVGGIAGFASRYSRFQDCFVKATLEVDNSKGCKLCIGGIAGMTYSNAVNCCTDVVINYNDDTMAKSIGGILASVTNGSIVNCHTNYSALGEYNAGTEVTGCSINVTDEQFASGEITYLLNGSKAESGSVWKQTLGEDDYPSFNGKYVDYDESGGYYNLAHMHSFEYSADGDTITATCTAKDCYLNNADGGTLRISAPADLYVDGTAKEATVENNLVDTSVAVNITYSTAAGTAPKIAGTHFARVTVGGATASVEFTLLNYAAMVTDKDGNELSGSPYKTLADAITAASASEGSTLTLLDDVTLTKEQNIRSGKFTLDLNGKNLINENGRVLYILEEADLTIKDSGEGGTIETKDESVDCIYNYGKLTVESGIIKGDGGIRNFGVLYFNDGTVEADNYPAIANYNDSTVYVYDGVFKGGKNSGAVENGGTLYVYGGEIESIVNVNDAYISGGKIDRDDYMALNLLGGTVEITGGSFTGTDNEYGRHSGTPYGEWTVHIDEDATLILKGGEFPNGFVADETTVNALLAEGYAFYDKDGNKITVADDAKIIDGYVKVKEHFVASVTDKDGNAVGTYKTFADAIAAAQGSEGGTLTLLDDITLTEEQYIRSGKFTLDLNGKTLLHKSTYFFEIKSDADITIKDSGENGTIESKEDGYAAIYNYGILTVENGTFKGSVGISNIGTLNFKNGEVEADNYSAISNSGTAYIYNGIFKSVDFGAISNNTGGTVYIYGGEFSGSSGIVNHGTAYIEGGEFKGNSYAAFNLFGGTVEVTGGSFTGTDNGYGSCSGTPYGEWTVCCTEGVTLTLKGGEFPNGFVTYKATANAFLAEDYYYKDADGKLIDVADDAKVIDGYVKISKGADLADAVITLDETQFTYNGMEHKPTVIVTVGSKALTEGKDYTLTFANNVNAGTATVTIKAVGQAAGGIAGGGEGNISNAGGSDESIYTGEVTKEFTINKKPVTATATAPDKVYDGTSDIEVSEIVINFEGIVEGDTVGYTIKEAWYNGTDAGVDKIIPIVFNVTGEDADNYSFPEGGEYIAPDYFVVATADITAKDISDGFIILGEALTYNGKEQTQTVEKVLPTGTSPEATYTVSGNKATNVGVYLLTVTGTGNFTGEAKIAFEISPDVECISHLDRVEDNGVMKWNVNSNDRASLEYVIDQLSNAVTDIADADTKNEWADTKEACEDMLRVINSIELAIADVEEDYSGFSEDTVKSSDISALDELVSKVNEIKDRYGFNLTDEEAKKLEDILDGVEKLREKIAETEEQLEKIADIENGYNPETVTSDDKAAIEEAIAEIEAINPDNLTDEQKAEYEEIKAGFEVLLEEIAAAEKAVADIGVEFEMFNEKRVTKFWEEKIKSFIARLNELLAGENMGEAEKAKLNEYKAQAEKLIEIINTPKEYFSLRFFYLVWDCTVWIYNGIIWLFKQIFAF